MKQNSKELLWLSVGELKELFGEDGLCPACRCVATGEDIDHLHVLIKHEAGSPNYDLCHIFCGKCWEAVFAVLPVVEEVFESRQVQPYPKAGVVPLIRMYAESFLKRGLDPRKRIRIEIAEIPADFDAEPETAEFRKELDEMKKQCRSGKQPDS